MARRIGRGRNSARQKAQRFARVQTGHDITRQLGGEYEDGRTHTTPLTPPTSAGPQRRSAPSLDTRQDAFQGGQNAASRRPGVPEGRVDRNLEMAYLGDDSMLLPYRPTNTINPRRPRTLAAGYDAENETLFVRFRDGAGYEYHDVNRSQWRMFKTTASPGRYINSELNHHRYNPADW